MNYYEITSGEHELSHIITIDLLFELLHSNEPLTSRELSSRLPQYNPNTVANLLSKLNGVLFYGTGRTKLRKYEIIEFEHIFKLMGESGK